MKVTSSEVFPEVLIIEPRVFEDPRGFFLETYGQERYAQHGLVDGFVQDNLSYSRKGVLRGLHYQIGRPQGKLVWVVQGEVYDVVVDVRKSSPTFGKWFGIILSALCPKQLYIPEGFAHGFCVTSEEALFCYKCTDCYSPVHERGIRWNDPDIAIKWPVQNPMVSQKDQDLPFLRELAEEALFP